MAEEGSEGGSHSAEGNAEEAKREGSGPGDGLEERPSPGGRARERDGTSGTVTPMPVVLVPPSSARSSWGSGSAAGGEA